MAHSQPIETYDLAPHNRNIWPSPTPTANQYKHMAQRLIIETYGHTIARRRRRRHAWPILLFVLVSPFYSLLRSISNHRFHVFFLTKKRKSDNSSICPNIAGIGFFHEKTRHKQ